MISIQNTIPWESQIEKETGACKRVSERHNRGLERAHKLLFPCR